MNLQDFLIRGMIRISIVTSQVNFKRKENISISSYQSNSPFVKWATVHTIMPEVLSGSLIQATGTVEFEDDLWIG